MNQGKEGSKIHLITERTGSPLSIGISGANLHDSQALKPTRARHPAAAHADDGPPSCTRTRATTTTTCPAGYASEASGTTSPARASSPPPQLGRHRWTIERTMSWLGGCRRLHRRYERKAEHFLAFTAIACSLICYRALAK